MPTVLANGVRLYYEQYGEGDDLLLITGLGGTVRSWTHQVPPFSERYRAVAFDLRGAGHSDKPEGPYTTQDLAEDAVALCDALGVSQCHIVGLGLGGMVAQSLAIDFPERVRALILVSTLARADAYVSRLFEIWSELLPQIGWEKLGGLMSLWTFTPDFFEKQPERLREIEASRKFRQQPAYAYRAQVSALLGHDRLADLHRINSPTLVMVGELDIETIREAALMRHPPRRFAPVPEGRGKHQVQMGVIGVLDYRLGIEVHDGHHVRALAIDVDRLIQMVGQLDLAGHGPPSEVGGFPSMDGAVAAPGDARGVLGPVTLVADVAFQADVVEHAVVGVVVSGRVGMVVI